MLRLGVQLLDDQFQSLYFFDQFRLNLCITLWFDISLSLHMNLIHLMLFIV